MSCGKDHFEPISFGPDPAPRPRRNWGGRRAGAGAPKGNLNAYRHGRYSTQQRDLARLLSEIFEARDALIRLAEQRRKRDAVAREGASQILAEILRRLGSIVVHPENNHLESRFHRLPPPPRIHPRRSFQGAIEWPAIINQPLILRRDTCATGWHPA